LGEREKMAWKQRDIAAHAKEIKEHDYIRLLKDIKLLKLRFHRMLLAITNASDSYIDYYTLGLPQRPLRDPIPGDTC
jgi:hypothetical protein